MMDLEDADIAPALAALAERLATKSASPTDVVGAPVQGVPVSKASKVLGIVEKKDDATGETLGLVFGWAIISKVGGEDYFDTQGDHIPEELMLKSAATFMESSRLLGDMHATAEGGSVVFAFPLTSEIAKAYGWDDPKQTGLMIAVRPKDEATLQKYRDGTYTGFSIGGRCKLEEVA